jgi:chemotaxis signal transduction protein
MDQDVHKGVGAMANEKQQSGIRTFFLPMTINDSTGNVFCLFSQSQVVEILGPRPIQQVPRSPAYLKGVLHYDDKLLPVISLDDLCNRKQKGRQERFRQLVVIRTGAVDLVTGELLKAVVTATARVRIAKLSGQELATAFVEREAPPSLRNSGVLRGFFQRHADSVAVFDLGPIVLGTVKDGLGEPNN